MLLADVVECARCPGHAGREWPQMSRQWLFAESRWWPCLGRDGFSSDSTAGLRSIQWRKQAKAGASSVQVGTVLQHRQGPGGARE